MWHISCLNDFASWMYVKKEEKIMRQCDAKIDLITNLVHSDLHFMVQWLYQIIMVKSTLTCAINQGSTSLSVTIHAEIPPGQVIKIQQWNLIGRQGTDRSVISTIPRSAAVILNPEYSTEQVFETILPKNQAWQSLYVNHWIITCQYWNHYMSVTGS